VPRALAPGLVAGGVLPGAEGHDDPLPPQRGRDGDAGLRQGRLRPARGEPLRPADAREPHAAQKCTRYLSKGSLKRTLRAGARRVKFQGRLSRTKRLALGRYRLTISAVDKAGKKSRNRTAFFTIVAR